MHLPYRSDITTAAPEDQFKYVPLISLPHKLWLMTNLPIFHQTHSLTPLTFPEAIATVLDQPIICSNRFCSYNVGHTSIWYLIKGNVDSKARA